MDKGLDEGVCDADIGVSGAAPGTPSSCTVTGAADPARTPGRWRIDLGAPATHEAFVRGPPVTLVELPVDQEAVLTEVRAEQADRAMLSGMGFAVGARVVRLRTAPFGGPVQVAVGDATFAIDPRLAAELVVDVVASP